MSRLDKIAAFVAASIFLLPVVLVLLSGNFSWPSIHGNLSFSIAVGGVLTAALFGVGLCGGSLAIRLAKLIWTALVFAVLLLSQIGYNQFGSGVDMQIAILMLVLSFPFGMIVVVVLGFNEFVITSQADAFCMWLALAISGWLQWFVLFDKLLPFDRED